MIRSLDSIFKDNEVDVEKALFLRCDTEMPDGSLGIVHARVGIDGEDIVMVRGKANAAKLAHTCVPPDEIDGFRIPDEMLYDRLSSLVSAAPVVVSYSWKTPRGFSQSRALEDLYDPYNGREALEIWPVFDVLEMRRAFLASVGIPLGASLSETAADIISAAASGPPSGGLRHILGEAYSTFYGPEDIKGARAMMWALVEVWKIAKDYQMFE